MKAGAARLSALALVLSAPRQAAADPAGPAPRTLEECDAQVRARPLHHGGYMCYQSVAWLTQDWRPAARRLEALLAERPGDPRAQLYLGVLYNDKGGDRSEALFRASAAGFQAEGDAGGEARARIFLHATLCEDGRCLEAAPEQARADELVARVDDPVLRGLSIYFKGEDAWRRGDFGRAEALYGEVRDLSATARSSWLRHRALDGLAEVYAATGRHRDAFDTYRAEVELLGDEPFFRALAQGGVAAEAAELADAGEMPAAEADRLVLAALSAQRRAGVGHYQRQGEQKTRLLLASRIGPTDEGVALAEGARAFGDQDRHAPLQIAARRLLARFHTLRSPGELRLPLRLVEESIARAREVGSRPDVARGLLVRAWVKLRGGQRRAGVADVLEALDELDRLRTIQPDPMVRALSASESAVAYELAAGWLVDPRFGAPDVPLAFASIERLRARVLQESIARGRLPAPSGPLGERLAQALGAIAHLQRRLLGELPEPERAALLAELAERERALLAVRDAVARLSPEPRALPEAADAASVQQELRDDEALLAFQVVAPSGAADLPVGDGSSWAVLLTRFGARAFPVPAALSLGRSVRVLAALIRRRDGGEAEAAARLHHDLLDGALAALPPGVTRLVIVPDGPLHGLPFEALRPAPDAPPLGERYQIALAPSAALWLRWRKSRPDAPAAPLLALADPAIDADHPAPDLVALPASRAEAAFAVERLGGGSRLYVGSEASEARLKREPIGRFAVLHLAAHALVDEERPERTALVLAPGGADEDGLLQLGEAAALDLPGRVVVLAACRSSSGGVLQGEGALSLARAFFQAGARAVVGTRWEVRDDEARDLLQAFYSALAERNTVSQALQRARARRRAAGAPTAAWAAFTLLGDGELVAIAGPRSATAARPLPLAEGLAVAAAALLLAALAVQRGRWR